MRLGGDWFRGCRPRRRRAVNVADAEAAGTKPGDVGTVEVGVGSVVVVVIVSVTVVVGVLLRDIQQQGKRRVLTDFYLKQYLYPSPLR